MQPSVPCRRHAAELLKTVSTILSRKPMNSIRTPAPVRSPCVKICELDPENGLCRGCHRTRDERDWWIAYSEPQQREVLQRCEQRRAVLAAGQGELAPNMGIVESRRRN